MEKHTSKAYRQRDDLVEQHHRGHVEVEHEILNISLITETALCQLETSPRCNTDSSWTL